MNYANQDKIDSQHFMSSNNFCVTFFKHIKMSKDSPAKYYQNNKKRIEKKLSEDIKDFLKKKKKKSNNMVMNDTKIYHKIKNKNLLSIEKNIIK